MEKGYSIQYMDTKKFYNLEFYFIKKWKIFYTEIYTAIIN